MHHRQSQAGSLARLLGREERIHGSCQGRFVHPLAGVDYRKANVFSGLEVVDLAPGDARWPGRDDDAASIWHRIARVDDKIEQRHFKLVGIGGHAGKTKRKTVLDRYGWSDRALQKLGHATQQRRDVDRLEVQFLTSCKG